MRTKGFGITLVILVVILSSCSQGIPIEDLTISLILGLDLDDENNLIIATSSPVFNKDSKKNIETYQIKAESIRDSRKYFDAFATGDVTSAKIQVVLIGKRILEHENWFSILDTVYRNPNFSLNSKVIMVDGPVSEVIFYQPEDKPQLPLHLEETIDNNVDRTRTVVSTLQMLHRQMYEKGITPTLTEMKKEKDLRLVGASLLNEKGKYVDTIELEDTSLLLVLMDQARQELTFSLPMTSIKEDGGIFHKNELSFDVSRVRTKVKTGYKGDKFHFKYDIQMTGNVVERLFPLEGITKDDLEVKIEKEMKYRLEQIIKKFQEHKIDPIGLGVHARAFQYEQYKKVEEQWGEALSKSEIEISLDIKIKSMGATR